MCRVGSSLVSVNTYSGINIQNKVADKKAQTKENTNIEASNSKKDCVNVNAKQSKNNVTHSVNIKDNDKPEQQDSCEKISKTTSSVIGNTQSAIDVTKKIATVGETTGKISKATKVINTAKALTSLSVVKYIDKVVSSPLANKALGVFSIVGGGFDVARGIKEIKKGKTETGIFSTLGGASSIVMGGALLVGAVPVAVAAGFVGLGVGVVKYGSKSVKDLGWLKGKDGKAQTAFEHLAEKSNDVQKAVQKATGSKVLGYVAKVGSGIAMVPAAVATSVAGAVVGGGKAIVNFVSKAWNSIF